MKTLLKNAREAKGIKTRELAKLADIDQALISKFESGTRNPTKQQIIKLAEILQIELEPLVILWLKEKILREIQNEPLGLKALKAAELEIEPATESNPEIPQQFSKLLEEMESLKSMLSAKK